MQILPSVISCWDITLSKPPLNEHGLAPAETAKTPDPLLMVRFPSVTDKPLEFRKVTGALVVTSPPPIDTRLENVVFAVMIKFPEALTNKIGLKAINA